MQSEHTTSCYLMVYHVELLVSITKETDCETVSFPALMVSHILSQFKTLRQCLKHNRCSLSVRKMHDSTVDSTHQVPATSSANCRASRNEQNLGWEKDSFGSCRKR